MGGIDYPGLEVHANVIDNMLNNGFLIRGAHQEILDLLLILIFGIPLGTALALGFAAMDVVWTGTTAAVRLVDLCFLYAWVLAELHPARRDIDGERDAGFPLPGAGGRKGKRKVRSAFGQYLRPGSHPAAAGESSTSRATQNGNHGYVQRHPGFTTISEKLDAQDLALFLNSYLSDMTKSYSTRKARSTSTSGDAVMALWGAPIEEPEHAANACTASLMMMNTVRAMQKQWEAERKTKLDIGIGLNTGAASVGNMGSVLQPCLHGAWRHGEFVFAAGGAEQGVWYAHPGERIDIRGGERCGFSFPRIGRHPCKRKTAASDHLRAGGKAFRPGAWT